MSEELDAAQIRAEREAAYGNTEVNMYAVGMVWAGQLSVYYQQKLPPIEPHMAALMLTTFKAIRGGAPTFVADVYPDLHNYADFALEFDPRKRQ